jgi:hypothetical protein
MMSIDINELAMDIHQQNKERGWWDKPRSMLTVCQLISTEVAEATEGARRDLMDTHLVERKMEEVELADTLIRTLDIGGYLDLEYSPFEELDEMTKELEVNINEPAAMHFIITLFVAGLGSHFTIASTNYSDIESASINYSGLIDCIIKVSELRGFDLWGAVTEKLEYNKARADHDRENREKVETNNMVTNMSNLEIKSLLKRIGVKCYAFVGSRVTCNPPVLNTDVDVLCLFGEGGITKNVIEIEKLGFKYDGDTEYESYCGGFGFASYSNHPLNLICTEDEDFYRRFIAASSIAKRLNLLIKEDRIALFQACVYGNEDSFLIDQYSTEINFYHDRFLFRTY